jgi:hypothetical protein
LFRDRLTEYVTDRWVAANLVIRFLLLSFAIFAGHWHSGDSNYYLNAAQRVCSGDWNGDPTRTPFYFWFLCLFGAGREGLQSTGLGLAPALVVQSLLVWLSGALLYDRRYRVIARCWLFEPALLAYSSFIMSDAVFAISILLLAVSASGILVGEPSARKSMILGSLLSLCTLIRPIGMVLIASSLVFLAYFWVLRGRRARQRASVQGTRALGVLIATCAVLLGPRIVWNGLHYQRWTLATQGTGWISTIAAAVEYSGQGLDFVESEKKWAEQKNSMDTGLVLKTLIRHFPTWVWLDAKGIARVFIGHANVEWTYLLTGVSPIGPGWSKVQEHRASGENAMVTGWWVLLWAFGFVVTAAFCLWVYLQAWRTARRTGTDRFVLWALMALLILAGTPQIFGDSRFRCAVWPLILAIWMHGARRLDLNEVQSSFGTERVKWSRQLKKNAKR